MAQPLSVPAPGGSEVALSIAPDGILLVGEVTDDLTYDLLINGQHVWSLQPGRDTTTRPNGRWAPWPPALKPFLEGVAGVSLREHTSGQVVGSAEHTFGDAASGPVTVLDSEGHPLLLDKWGRLIRPLSQETEEDREYLSSSIERLLASLNDRCGVPSFVAYGTLLGAVRTGDLIGHDNDIDLAYVSFCKHPADVSREAFRVERLLKADGWDVRRGSTVRINVRVAMPGGGMRFIDVFTYGWIEDLFYMPMDIAVHADPDILTPLGSVTLMGREVTAPAQPEKLLELAYGPNWRIPDPSFRYDIRRWLRRRFDGWYGNLNSGRKHWDNIAKQTAETLPEGPSDFARWVHDLYPSKGRLVDVGSGPGRDAIWFASQGRPTVGLDFALGFIDAARARAQRRDLEVEFRPFNLSDSRQVLTLGALLAREETPPDLYARLLLSAIKDDTRANLWRLASMALRRGGRLFLEFRTPADATRPHVFDDAPRKRRFCSREQIEDEITTAGGHVEYATEGDGLAVFQHEDPWVCRIVATWS